MDLDERRSFAPVGLMKREPPSGKATLPELRRDVFDLHECLESTTGKVDKAAKDISKIKGSIEKYDRAWEWGERQAARLKRWRKGLYIAAGTFALAVIGGAGASAWTVASGILWPHVTKADVTVASQRTTDAVARVVVKARAVHATAPL